LYSETKPHIWLVLAFVEAHVGSAHCFTDRTA
jgi:hypothetical protein